MSELAGHGIRSRCEQLAHRSRKHARREKYIAQIASFWMDAATLLDGQMSQEAVEIAFCGSPEMPVPLDLDVATNPRHVPFFLT